MDGVSVFDAEQTARAQDAVFATRTSGSPFRFIATLHIPQDSSVECDDAFGNKHHWDLYASPPELLACVAVHGWSCRLPLCASRSGTSKRAT